MALPDRSLALPRPVPPARPTRRFAGVYNPTVTGPCSGSTTPTCDQLKAQFFSNPAAIAVRAAVGKRLARAAASQPAAQPPAVQPPAALAGFVGLPPTALPVLARPAVLSLLSLQYYQQYATALANRVNSINGRVYKDDPTLWWVGVLQRLAGWLGGMALAGSMRGGASAARLTPVLMMLRPPHIDPPQGLGPDQRAALRDPGRHLPAGQRRHPD